MTMTMMTMMTLYFMGVTLITDDLVVNIMAFPNLTQNQIVRKQFDVVRYKKDFMVKANPKEEIVSAVFRLIELRNRTEQVAQNLVKLLNQLPKF